MIDYQLYIDGEFCEASDGNRFDSFNPANGRVWATAPAATEADVNRAVEAAREALYGGDWQAMTPTQRGRALYRLADLVEAHSDRLGEIETTDSGKLGAETRLKRPTSPTTTGTTPVLPTRSKARRCPSTSPTCTCSRAASQWESSLQLCRGMPRCS